MKIQAISPAFSNSQAKRQTPAFGALWFRLGENYLDSTKYHTALMFPLKDGIQKPVQELYKGSPVLTSDPIDLTVEESKNAFSFLFENKRDDAGYVAVKKLKKFVDSLTRKEYEHDTLFTKHNTLFIEEDDIADVNEARKELNITDISVKISDYERENHLVEYAPKADVKPQNIPTTSEKMLELLTKRSSETII